MRLWLLLCVCRGLAEKGSNSGSRGKRGFDVRVIRYVQWFKLWTWLLIMQQWPTLTKHTVRKMLDVDICTCHILKVGNYTVNTKSGKNCFKFICSLVLVGETDQEEKAVIESVLMKCWLNKHMDQWSKEWLAERINKLIRMDGGIDGIAYWTRISVLQWHWRTVFVLSSWCKCLRHILCVCLCRFVCGCACVLNRIYIEIVYHRFWSVWTSEIKYSACSSGRKHLETICSLSGWDDNLSSTPKNIHVLRSKAFVFPYWIFVHIVYMWFGAEYSYGNIFVYEFFIVP